MPDYDRTSTPPPPPAKTRYLKRLEFQIEVKGFMVKTWNIAVVEHESGIDIIDARDTNKAPGYYVQTDYIYKEICRIVCVGPMIYSDFLRRRSDEIRKAESNVREIDRALSKGMETL